MSTKPEFSSEELTERDLWVLDTILTTGLNFSTHKFLDWVGVGRKVIEQIPITEVQNLLGQFVDQVSGLRVNTTVLDDGRSPRMEIEYKPGEHVAFSYATTHGEFSIQFELAAIILARASR